MQFTAYKLVATNDADGNIRHGWEVRDGQRIVARVKSHYMGLQALRNVLTSLGVEGAQDVMYRIDDHDLGEKRISTAEYDSLDDPPAVS